MEQQNKTIMHNGKTKQFIELYQMMTIFCLFVLFGRFLIVWCEKKKPKVAGNLCQALVNYNNYLN